MSLEPEAQPLRARTVYGWLAVMMLAIFVMSVLAIHVALVESESTTRALVEHGRTTRITNVDDVRVDVSHDKFTYYITSAEVRIDGTWMTLVDSREDAPDDVDVPWFRHDGVQPPARASHSYPPFDVRYVPGTTTAAKAGTYEYRAADGGGTQWLWVVDATAAIVAALMVRHLYRRLKAL